MKAYTAARWAAGQLALWNPLSGCGEPWLAQLQTGVLYPGDLPFLLRGAAGPSLAIALHVAIAAAGMAAWLSSPRHVARGRARGRGDVGGRRRVPLPRSRLQQLRDGRVPAVALPRGAPHGARRVSGGLRARGRARVPRRRARARGGRLRGRRARRLRDARRKGPPARRPGPARAALAGCGRPRARPVSRGRFARAVPRPRDVERARHGRDEGRGARAPGRPLGPRGPRRPADGRRDAPAGPGPGRLPPDARARAAPVRPRGGRRERGSRRARAFSRRSSLSPPPASSSLSGPRGGARPSPVGRGARARRPLSGALVRLRALRSRGGRRRRPRRLARRASPRVAGPRRARSRAAPQGPARRFGRSRGRHPRGPRRVRRLRAPRRPGLAAWIAFAAAAAGVVLLGLARFGRTPSRELCGALLVLCVGLPLPLGARDVVAGAPAAELERTPRIVADLAPGSAGRVFPVVSDGALLRRWLGGGAWTAETALRGHEALAGYGSLSAGLASAASPSPIGNPWRTRLLGAALSGGNAETLLGLVDVRHVVSPFPAALPGARLERRAGDVLRYALSRPLGRVFFARESAVVEDDAAFEALSGPAFDPEARALVAPGAGALPPPRAAKGFAVAHVTRDEPEALALETATSEAALLVVTRSWDAGWEARLDGARVPLRRCDLALMAVPVPAGEHRLELAYRPAAWRAGVAVSGVFAPRPPRPRPRRAEGAGRVTPAEAVPLVFSGAAGAIAGSFANVCIHRLPRGESVVHPPSRCPKCGTRVAWYDNVPVLSWLAPRRPLPRVPRADLAALSARRGRRRRDLRRRRSSCGARRRSRRAARSSRSPR